MHQTMATFANQLFDFYPPQEIGNPETFLAGVIELFEHYPSQVIATAVSPVYGIPSKYKFIPRISEIKEFLEARMAPIRREQERRAIEAERLAMLPPPIDRSSRPTYEELQARCAADGLIIGKARANKYNTAQAAKDFCDKNGISAEEFNSIPNAR